MTLGRKYKKKPQRTITTRSFKPNTDLLNKLTNSSELPHSTGMQSNMAVNSSSASNNHFHEISSEYDQLGSHFVIFDQLMSCCVLHSWSK